MRPLTQEETKALFEKLSKYIGRNITFLIDRKDEPYCFRLHKQRVYYLAERLMRKAENFEKKRVMGLGVCMGKFSRTGIFRLHISALDIMAQYARYKLWIKPAAELSYLYGNHVVKAGLGRITENTQRYQGVVIYSMSDIPLGFGVMAKSTSECRGLGPTDLVCIHQADLGEYLRHEQTAV